MREIKDFSGYFVGQDGRVFSRKSGKSVELSVQENADGYYVVNLFSGGKYHHKRVNRLVAETYIPNPNNFPVVHHKDDDRKNNSVGNLEWCTADQNNMYKVERKRHSFGTSHGMSELTEQEVVEIYNRLLAGADLSICQEYGVSERTIFRIKSKQSWKHLLESLPEIPIKERRVNLTEEEVEDICKRLSSGETQSGIAKSLGIDRQVVFRIKKGVSFKHISSRYNFS